MYNHKKISSSTLKTFMHCPRKWYYDAFSGEPASSSEATVLGSEVHAILESYLKGESMEEVLPFFSQMAQQLAKRNIEHMWLPTPLMCEAEVKFNHYTGLVGEIDCIVEPDYRDVDDLARFGSDTNVPLIVDHKTSSSISSYALTEDTMRDNIQVICYANVVLDMFPHCENVDLLWNYMQTTGSKQSQVMIRMSRQEATQKLLNRLMPSILEMQDILNNKDLQQETLFKQETSYCPEYGGCSRMSVCNPVIESHIMDFEDVLAESNSIGRGILVLKGTISPKDSYIDQKQFESSIKKTLVNPTESDILKAIELMGWDKIIKIDRRKRKSLYILKTLEENAKVVIK